MRIAFMGEVMFSARLLEQVLLQPRASVVGVVTRRSAPARGDRQSLEPLAQRAGVPHRVVGREDPEAVADFLRPLAPDVVYCFGWSSRLGPDVLGIPPLGVIGYHPSLLPNNRGRHPIVWALVLGLQETGSSFFVMDEGLDSGDLVSQERVSIDPAETASTLYGKLMAVACRQIVTLTRRLEAGDCPRIPQDPRQATYWRKRSVRDGRIDWRMSAATIYNLVRALTRPYPGAHCVWRGEPVRIWDSLLQNEAPEHRRAEPGKLLRAEGRVLWVKCGEGVLRLLDHEFVELPAEGAYL